MKIQQTKLIVTILTTDTNMSASYTAPSANFLIRNTEPTQVNLLTKHSQKNLKNHLL